MNQLESSCSQNNLQPMTDRSWRINTPIASPLGWDNSEGHVLKSFPELPSGIKLQRPTVVPCFTPHTGNRTRYTIGANGIPRWWWREIQTTAVHQRGKPVKIPASLKAPGGFLQNGKWIQFCLDWKLLRGHLDHGQKVWSWTDNKYW